MGELSGSISTLFLLVEVVGICLVVGKEWNNYVALFEHADL